MTKSESLNYIIAQQKSEGVLDTNEIRDGYHSFGELYDHRIELFIALCRVIEGKENDAWKIIPENGWFIMGIGKELGRQITYHIPESKWHETQFCQVITKDQYYFDGHTSQDVLKRLKNL
jgi:hypothetical protein